MAYDDSGGYANQSSVSLATGTYNNVGRTLVPQLKVNGIVYPAFSSGATKVLYINPTGGNVTITGLSAEEASSGHTIMIVNLSSTNLLLFPNLTGSTLGNQFSNMSAGTVSINQLGAARCTWLFPPGAANGFWQFA